jgi:DNA-binding NtrC family response regulator
MYQPEIERISEELYFIAASPATRRLRTQAELLSQTDVPVLITGEPGAGRRPLADLSIPFRFVPASFSCGSSAQF